MLPTKFTLNNNEIIMKEILPRKSFFFNTLEKARIVFSFFYVAISIFFISCKSSISILGVIMLSIGLYFAIFKWVLKYFDIKSNYYLITNQRIIILEKLTEDIEQELNLAQISLIKAEMNNRFFGNINFKEKRNIFNENNDTTLFLGERKIHFDDAKFAFLSVENINEVIPVFEELGLKVKKTFY